MVKRSRLRDDRRGKGWLIFYGVLAGTLLLMALRFFGGWDYRVLESLSSFGGKTEEGDLLDSRGTIYDRNFKELAVTLEKVSVYVNVRDVNIDEVSQTVAGTLDMEPEKIREAIRKEPYRAWIAKNISQQQEEELIEQDIPGVFLYKKRMRYYPQKETASHLVGFVGKSMGLSGVEYRYNNLLTLSGELGDKQTKSQESQEESGEPYLVLNVDLKIQKILEEYLSDLQLGKYGGRGGALLMECKSGKIISAAGYPSFDPNNFRDYGLSEMENILADPISIPQEIRRLFWDSSLVQSTFEESGSALPWSLVSEQRNLGSQLRLWDRLGLNDPLTVDFIKTETALNADSSLHPNVKEQGVDVADHATPMHIVEAVNGLIRGGEKVVPHALDRIVNNPGKEISLKPEGEGATVSEEVAGEVQNLFSSIGVNGPLSSKLFETDSLSYGKVGIHREYQKNKFMVSAIPAENPELMLFVFVKLPAFSPTSAETKSRLSLTAKAHNIIERVYTLQAVRAGLSDMVSAEDKGDMNFQTQEETEKTLKTNNSEAVFYTTMPDLRGLSLRKSLRHIRDLKMEIQIVGSGVVVDQMPAAGQQVRQGEFCRLTLKPH